MIGAWNDLLYSIICRNQQQILCGIRKKEDVEEYDWIIRTVRQQPWPWDFEGRYRRFWRMRGVAESFYPPYFEALKTAGSQVPSVGHLCKELLAVSTRKKKKSQETCQTLQFSYPTKLCHTANPKLPIYDTNVAQFYLFQEPSTRFPQPMRIKAYLEFYEFLRGEYARVLKNDLLRPAIDCFKQKFNPKQHSDEKIVDWLIWAFIVWVDSGALLNGPNALCVGSDDPQRL